MVETSRPQVISIGSGKYLDPYRGHETYQPKQCTIISEKFSKNHPKCAEKFDPPPQTGSEKWPPALG